MTFPCGRKYCCIDECHDLGCREVEKVLSAACRRQAEEMLKDQIKALGFLQRAGILDKHGKLSKHYK